MPSPRKYLDPEVISKLSRLDLQARLVVEGFLSGLHQSPYKGFSQEFADYRPYMPGDEPRRIDWKVFARSDRYYIKQYLEETNLRAYILFDISGSMAYGDRISKLEYAKYLCASLAYILSRQKDGVGIITFDSKIREYVPPSAKKVNLSRILGVIDGAAAGGETSIADVLGELAQKTKRRGLIIIVSDLLDQPESVVRAIRSFRFRKHEMLVFQVLDKKEFSFPYADPALFKDLETDDEMIVYPAAIRASYQKHMEQFIAFYRRALLEVHIDCETVFTDTPYDQALIAFLHKRMKML
ncbi:MAG TPA: DUF58 domain-containing protein [bacterium]